MITYAQYMADSHNLHNDYYAQFVTPSLVELVRERHGAEIAACTDDYFNNIPLYEKDRIAALMQTGGYFRLKLWQEAEESKGCLPSQATRVCAACAAMRQARKDMEKPQTPTDFLKVICIGRGPSGNIYCSIRAKAHDTKGSTVLSIKGVEGPRGSGDCVGGYGQIQDSILAYVTDGGLKYGTGWDAETVTEFVNVWERWHLNDMRAGSPAQEAHLRELGETGDYETIKELLSADGLNPDASYLHKGKPYAYGSAWLLEEVPAHVLEWLFALPECSVKPAWV